MVPCFLAMHTATLAVRSVELRNGVLPGSKVLMPVIAAGTAGYR